MTRLIRASGLAILLSFAASGQTPTKEFIYLGGRLIAIEQTGPSLTVSPNAVAAVAGGSTAIVAVTANVGVAWTATTADAWITISGASGSGNGVVTLTIAANGTSTQRQGTVQIGGAVVTVTQTGANVATNASPDWTAIYLPATGGTAGFPVSAPAGQAWTAISNASWLTFTNGPNGTGSQTFYVTAAASPGGAFRHGTVNIGGNLVHFYEGSGSTAPSLGTTTITGSGGTRTITATANQDPGAGAIQWFQVLINTGFDGRDACYFNITPIDRRIALVSDDGVSWSQGGYPGEPRIIGNTQCSVNLADVLVTVGTTANPNLLSVTLPVSFSTLFAGAKQVYTVAGNVWGQMNSGVWVNTGSFTAFAAPAAPTVTQLSVTPSSGQGASGIFTFRASSAAGGKGLLSGGVIFNTVGNSDGCWISYHRSSRRIKLESQGAYGVGGEAVAGTPNATFETNYCKLYVGDSSIYESGNEMILTIRLDFKAYVAGATSANWAPNTKYIYFNVWDRALQDAGYPSVGTWNTTGTPSSILNMAVASVGVSGTATVYEASAFVDGGASTVTSTDIGFGPNGTDFRDACLVSYNKSSGQVSLAKDGFSWEKNGLWLPTTGTLGSSTVLENSQCKVYLAASSDVTAAGSKILKLRLAIEFLPMFAGAKTIYQVTWVGGQSNAGGYQLMGTVTPYPLPAMPAPLSVTPNAGSGTSQTFLFKSTTPLGGSFVHSMVWSFDSTYNSGSPSCKILVHRSSQRVELYNNATFSGAGWIGDTPSPTFTNPNCSLNLTAATMALAPGQPGATTTLDVSLPITFTPNWGAKNIWMRTLDKAMQYPVAADMGDWTVGSGTAPANLGSTTATVPAEGGSGEFQMNTTGGWTISFDSTLVDVGLKQNGSQTATPISSGATGTGPRTVTFTAKPNPGVLPRSITIQINTDSFTISQAGQPGCAVSPSSAAVWVNGGFGFAALVTQNGITKPAADFQYNVVWSLVTSPTANAGPATSNFGTIGPGTGQYQAPSEGGVMAYAKATCSKGTYILPPSFGQILVHNLTGGSPSYTVSAGWGSSPGRTTDIVLSQMTGTQASSTPVDVLVVADGGAATSINQCHLVYNPSQIRMIELMDNDDVAFARPYAWQPTKATTVLNNNTQVRSIQTYGSGMAANTQCMVDYERAWDALRNFAPYKIANLPVHFFPTFIGAKEVKVRDQSGVAAIPWTTLSLWTVPNLATNPPAGQIQSPLENATVSGPFTFNGWAIDSAAQVESSIDQIKVYMDGHLLGTASYGLPTDVCSSYPGRQSCATAGFSFSMTTVGRPAGSHLFEFVLEDKDAPTPLRTILSRRVIFQ